jgi:hypothetical protein
MRVRRIARREANDLNLLKHMGAGKLVACCLRTPTVNSRCRSGRHLGADQLPFSPASFGVGGTLAMIGFLEGTVRLGHDLSLHAIRWINLLAEEPLNLPSSWQFEKTDRVAVRGGAAAFPVSRLEAGQPGRSRSPIRPQSSSKTELGLGPVDLVAMPLLRVQRPASDSSRSARI